MRHAKAESTQPETTMLHPKAVHVVETLLSSSATESAETINYATDATVTTDKKTTKHAFNLLEHEIKNPLAAIQTNQELLSDQLHFLVKQHEQGSLVQTADYRGKHPVAQTLGIAIHITNYSLESLSHIGEIFTNVRQLTGLFRKQEVGMLNAKATYKTVRLKKWCFKP